MFNRKQAGGLDADQQKVQLFERTPIPRAVATLAVPTIVSSLVMVLYNMADTYFVGMLNDPVQNAAVTLAAPVLLAFYAITNLFGVGASSMMSRALGRRDYEAVRVSSSLGFYCALFCAVAFSLGFTAFQGPFLRLLGADSSTRADTAAYLFWTVSCGAVPSIVNIVLAYLVRAEGASLHASIGSMSGCLLNILLDPVFILPQGLNMGAAGAGLATLLSNCAACLYFFALLALKRGSTYVSVNPARLRFDRAILLGICSVGIPAAIQNLLNVTGITVLNNFTSAFGSDAVAAMGIAQRIHMVPTQVAFGFTQGIMPLVGYCYASGDRERFKKTIFFAGRIIAVSMLAVAAGCYAGARPLTVLFIKNPSVVAYGTRFLRAFSFAIPFFSIDFLGVGIFQACGLGRQALVFAILRKIVLEIPALYVLNALFPLYGLPYSQTVAELVLCVAVMAVLRRLMNGPMEGGAGAPPLRNG